MTPSIARTQLTADYSIPKIINGGWQLATGHALAHALDMKDAHNAFAELLDRGFDTFDCADIYTGVEAFYGQIIAERRRAGLSLPQIHTKFVPDLKDLAHVDRAYVERVIERSLSRLGVERLDMVQFHWWNYDVPGMIDTAGELMRLQEKGLIRCISTTNFSTANLKKLVDAGIPVVTNQCQYSLLDRRPEKAMTDFCRRSGVKLIAYGTVAGGFLSDKWLGKPEPDLQSLENRSLVKYLLVIEDTLGWAGYQKLLVFQLPVCRLSTPSVSPKPQRQWWERATAVMLPTPADSSGRPSPKTHAVRWMSSLSSSRRSKGTALILNASPVRAILPSCA